MEKINIGVIGCGYWGPNLIRNFVEVPNSNVRLVADLREERLKTIRVSYPQIRTTRDYSDIFKDGIDAVVIATPPATHYKLAKECLENRLHVMVEKPLTLTSIEAQDLIETAEKNDRILMVGHTFEYNAAVQYLKKMVESGELGDIYYVDAARLNLGLFQKGLNVLWDLAPHDISILLYILGKLPVSVTAQGMTSVFSGIHDVVYMNLTFTDRLMAHVHVSWLDPCKVRRVTVVGSKKMVVFNDTEAVEKIKIYDKGIDAPPYTQTFDEFQFSYRYGDVLIPNIRCPEPLRLEVQHFLDCIGNHSTPTTCGRDGLRVVKILEAAQKSLTNCSHPEVIQW